MLAFSVILNKPFAKQIYLDILLSPKQGILVFFMSVRFDLGFKKGNNSKDVLRFINILPES